MERGGSPSVGIMFISPWTKPELVTSLRVHCSNHSFFYSWNSITNEESSGLPLVEDIQYKYHYHSQPRPRWQKCFRWTRWWRREPVIRRKQQIYLTNLGFRKPGDSEFVMRSLHAYFFPAFNFSLFFSWVSLLRILHWSYPNQMNPSPTFAKVRRLRW